MSAVNEQEVENTASRVDKIIADAPPVRTEAEQVKNLLKEKMRAVLRAMEQARERLGNFCVTVGDPDDPYHHGVILTTPIEDRYSQEYIDKAKGKTVTAGGTEATSSLTYVLITENGFYLYDFHEGRYYAYSPIKTPTQLGRDIRGIVEQAARLTTATVNSSELEISGNTLTVNPNFNNRRSDFHFGATPADQVKVERALQASIKNAQESFAKSTDRSKLALQTVATVAQQIGMETPSDSIPSAPPVSKKRFGLF